MLNIKSTNIRPLVSVVIPVYNVEKYIKDCITSVIGQSYNNLQIIIINDGSNDKSEDICNEFAKKDSRIIFIQKQNGGLSDARNVGINNANGEYIVFIDSDDYISPNFIEIMLTESIKNQSDIVACSYYKTSEHGSSPVTKNIEIIKLTNTEAVIDVLSPKSICEVMTWNKIYKTRLFKEYKITFPVGKIHEDNFTTFRLFYYANNVLFINLPLYYYRQRANSIMSQGFSERSINMIEAAEYARQWLNGKGLDFQKDIEANYLSAVITYANLLVESKINDNKYWGHTYFVKKNIQTIFTNEKISVKNKFILSILLFGRKTYVVMRHAYKFKRTTK